MRSSSLKTGQQLTLEHKVTFEDTAVRYGSGNLEVLATPALIALMENAALDLVAPSLSDSESTVGTEISIKHIKATAAGSLVKCTAILEQINEKQLVFKVEAHEKDELIGFGKHVRYVIDVDRFMSKLTD